jgi:hypothetical protein
VDKKLPEIVATVMETLQMKWELFHICGPNWIRSLFQSPCPFCILNSSRKQTAACSGRLVCFYFK